MLLHVFFPKTLRQFAAVVLICILPATLFAAPPVWWAERGVIRLDSATGAPFPADDFAAANQGQLKAIATAAFAEFQTRLANLSSGIGDMTAPNGTGYRLTQLIAGFESTRTAPTPGTDDFAALNLGQLKATAKPFYDRLIELHFLRTYPWSNSIIPANDYAMANVGQLKSVFSFELAPAANGLPALWIVTNFGSLNAPLSGPADDPDGDGLTNLAEFTNGTDPTDYYNGTAPRLLVDNGNNQSGLANAFLANPLVVWVTDASGIAKANAPITFSSASAQIATSPTADLSSSLLLRTDGTGRATIFVKLPSTGFQHQVTAMTGIGSSSAQVVFDEFAAQMQSTPSVLNFFVEPGNSANQSVTWTNISGAPTTYVSSVKQITGPAPSASATYFWKDSDAADGPTFIWNDISTTGTRLDTVSDADDRAEPLADMGFSFPFYDSQFSSVWVCSNGFLYFGSSELPQFTPYQIPTTLLPPYLISGFRRDLDTRNGSHGGDIYFQRKADSLTIQFESVSASALDGTYTFQMVLDKSGSITFYYKTMIGVLSPATVGIQNGATAPAGVPIAFNASYVHNNLAVRIDRNVSVSASPKTTTLATGQNVSVTVGVTAGQNGQGTYAFALSMLDSAGHPLGPPLPVNVEMSTDFDHDGLSNAEEALLGTDPLNPDTNGDGISDGQSMQLGISPTLLDQDGDGLTNAQELALGLDPFRADTDGDGVPDGLDAFPLDPTRWQALVADPNDHTPPTISLTKPLGATLVP